LAATTAVLCTSPAALAKKAKTPKHRRLLCGPIYSGDDGGLGQTYGVTVTMQNAGDQKLEPPENFNLVRKTLRIIRPGAQAAFPLSTTVARNGTFTFTFNVIAPSTSGNFNFQWQMLQAGSGFGSASTDMWWLRSIVHLLRPPQLPSPRPHLHRFHTPTPSATPTQVPLPSLENPTVLHRAPKVAKRRNERQRNRDPSRLASDEASAIISFSYSNLSSRLPEFMSTGLRVPVKAQASSSMWMPRR